MKGEGVATHSTESGALSDHNANRLLLRIEHAIYTHAAEMSRHERAEVMADVRAVLVSERVITSPDSQVGA